jgi:hypothetical protein
LSWNFGNARLNEEYAIHSNSSKYRGSENKRLSAINKFKEDKEARVAFCTDMIGLLRETPDIMNNLLMTDEAHFHLSGVVNKQNMRYWSSVNRKELHEMPLSRCFRDCWPVFL